MTGRRDGVVLRNSRPTRWLHAAVYLTTGLAGITGIGLWGEGIPALADRLGGHTRTVRLHSWLGYAVAVPPIVALVARPRAVARFLADIVRIDRGDAGWWRRLPRYIVAPSTAPLPCHRGHFDPGQRLMAIGLVACLTVLVASGVLMVVAVDLLGPRFGLALRAHTLSAIVLAVLVVAHVVVSAGLPKGYRGVWRAMHPPGRGRVPRELARRLWPAWEERHGQPDDDGNRSERARSADTRPD